MACIEQPLRSSIISVGDLQSCSFRSNPVLNMSAVLHFLNLVVLFLFVLWEVLQLIMMCGQDSI